MFVKISGDYTQFDSKSRRILARCPACLREGTLDSIGLHDVLAQNSTISFGMRRCPNPTCQTHIFFIQHIRGGKTFLFPPERLDFDATDIPEQIKKAFEEAVSCHSVECYSATALMVRRTLEELCKDRGAAGKTLKDRLIALGGKVVLPKELMDALDNIRLLGNDAAHVESQGYTQIGKEEVEIAIEFTKEVLKAVYQYAGLLKRLNSLKKPTP
jgi:hypothetical protein